MIKELKEKRNKLMADAQALITSANVTAEQRAQFDAMIADVDTVEADIARIEKLEARVAAQKIERPTPGAQLEGNVTEEQRSEEKKQAEKRAFSAYIRHGVVSADLRRAPGDGELRDITTAAGSGGYVIPQAFYPELIESRKAWGGLANIVKVRNTDGGQPMKVALVDDSANLLTVIGENVAASETDPTFAGKTLSTDFASTGIVKVSIAELQDSAFDVDAFIRETMGKRYWRGLDYLMNNGSTNIATVVSGATAAVTSAAPTAIAYGEIVSTYAALDPAYLDTSSWVFSSTTRAYLMGVVDSYGRPLYIPSPNAGALDTLLGRPVVLSQNMPAVAATKIPILFGDFASGYLLRTVNPGLSVVRLNERYAELGMVGFVGFARAGGITTDAGTHPVTKLTMHV